MKETQSIRRAFWAGWICLAFLLVSRSAAQSDMSGLPPAVPGDSAAVLWPDSLQALSRDSLSTRPGAEIKVVRRSYKYKEQLRLALFMMAFVAVALTASQEFNPR
jgi:hypothetical protein